MSSDDRFPVLSPNLQITFYQRLEAVRHLFFREALQATVRSIDLPTVDSELSANVTKDHLSRVASFGLRGEIFFPVPCVLIAQPSLL